jgi:hypothetical protein
VNQSAEAYSKRIRSQHSHTFAEHSHAVNGFLFIFFRMVTSNRHANFIFGVCSEKNERNEQSE